MRNKQVQLFVYGLIAAVSSGMGILFIYSDNIFSSEISKDNFITSIMTFTAVLAVALTIGSFILRYLRSDSEEKYLRSEEYAIKRQDQFLERLERLDQDIKRLSTANINVDFIQNLAEDIFTEKVSELTRDSIINEVKEEFRQDSIATTRYKIIAKHFDEVKRRISSQMSSLTKSSNLNLTIGIITTALVIGFLAVSVTNVNPTEENYKMYLIKFIPRLSLSIVVEIFAYFFLKLYTKNLDELKYWQNEFTNLEMKSIAFQTALLDGNENNLEKATINFIATERNFILQKGETTVDLEREKQAQASNSTLINSLIKLLNPNK